VEPLRRGCDCTIVVACGDASAALEAAEIVWRHHYLNVEVVDPCGGVDAICESAQRTHRLLVVDRDYSGAECSIDVVLAVLNALPPGSVITSARCAGWDIRSVVRAIEKMFKLYSCAF
jgi:pyruvate/2-oxoglutarate/acetoin dehydrogenase E1 component